MCIKDGYAIPISTASSTALSEDLLIRAIPGDVITLANPTFDRYFLYLCDGKVAGFSEEGVKEFELFAVVEDSVSANIYRCCDVWKCSCRFESILRARDEITGATHKFTPGSYNLISKNGESFCFYCVHREPYTSRGVKGVNYGIIPASTTGGGALAGLGIGAGLGLLSGPFAPITVPAGAAVGSAIGAVCGLVSSFTGGAIDHWQKWSKIKSHCSNRPPSL